jgi:hypothetical protein
MTSPRKSEELAQVGPGTVTRNFMREYWMPAAISSELARDGDPIRFGCATSYVLGFRTSQTKGKTLKDAVI